MGFKALPRSYGIETMADAVFTLERSDDPAHRAMAADCHAHGPAKMIDTAREVARDRCVPRDQAA